MLQLSWSQPPNDYPDSDGKPMAETDLHRDQMNELIQTLDAHYQHRTDVYVSGNILWFYQEGDRRRHLSPDVLVRFGSPKAKRNNYLQWLEGGGPQVIIEITSKSTRREDLGRKLQLYQQLGVLEYYLFDPREEYLKPRFRSYHRLAGSLVSVLGETVYSPVLELDLLVLDDKLRLRNPSTRQLVPTLEERLENVQERVIIAEQAATRAREREAELEAEIRRLRAALKGS